MLPDCVRLVCRNSKVPVSLKHQATIYFADATIASAFVARWCAGHRAASLDGLFQIREDEPKKRVPLKGHKTP